MCGDSLREEQPLFQEVDGGANPTSPLQYRIRVIEAKAAKKFTQRWHYSHTCPAGTHRFGLFDKDTLIGAAVFGQVIGRSQAAYWYSNAPDKLIELRRLCCIDATPKNTESRFIGYCLRWLKKNTDYEAVLSLADTNVGHIGKIYQATNFKLVGETVKDGHPRLMIDGVERHARDMYDKHGSSSTKLLKEIYGERIEFKPKKAKRVYLYTLLKAKEEG